ncbi:TetR family transcriptional regulator [Kitasatospora sp. NE20-6]|uniref:TetR/AcrR family transcriptional regulator n=1 Tax=Kitasatospora sp. NE20-6 TaxID=2859066 RepID=UPI0034DC7F32
MDTHRTPSAPGLRERKKQATRQALSWAAIRLTVERGLDNVLVEDIAAEAGVSARTFNNYFSSKAEAIAARHLDRSRRVADALRERPAAEPLWPALLAAVLAEAGGEAVPDPQWAAGVRLMVTDPALQGEMLKAGAEAARELAVAVAERTGADAERDLHPQLVAAAVGAAVQVATAQWLREDTATSMSALLREALELLAAGLPAPSAP